MAASARQFGDANRWRPNAASRKAATWRTAADTRDPLSFTLVEADVHAVLLVRSALAHTHEVGRAISSRQPFLPLSIGRVALEHALRALYLTDEDAPPEERAARRLDELLFAIKESDWRRKGAAKMKDVDADQNAGVDEALAGVEARAEALGLTVTTNKKGSRVTQEGRPSTMDLAEHYLSGENPGVLNFLLRGHGAIVHGIETGLLASARDDFHAELRLNVPVPGLSDVPVLAFELLGIPPAIDNAFRSMASQFGWPADGKPWRKFEQSRTRLFDVWTRAVNAAPPEGVGRTAIGLFGTS